MAAIMSNREEDIFGDRLRDFLRQHFPELVIETRDYLINHIWVDPQGNITPAVEDYLNPNKRGFRYQQDLTIRDEKAPFIAIELENGGFNTNHILTYAAKAEKIKNVYPYIRYGYVVQDEKDRKIPTKFFENGDVFDFVLVIPNDDEFPRILSIIKEQLESVKIMMEVLKDFNTGNPYSSFSKICKVK